MALAEYRPAELSPSPQEHYRRLGKEFSGLVDRVTHRTAEVPEGTSCHFRELDGYISQEIDRNNELMAKILRSGHFPLEDEHGAIHPISLRDVRIQAEAGSIPVVQFSGNARAKLHKLFPYLEDAQMHACIPDSPTVPFYVSGSSYYWQSASLRELFSSVPGRHEATHILFGLLMKGGFFPGYTTDERVEQYYPSWLRQELLAITLESDYGFKYMYGGSYIEPEPGMPRELVHRGWELFQTFRAAFELATKPEGVYELAGVALTQESIEACTTEAQRTLDANLQGAEGYITLGLRLLAPSFIQQLQARRGDRLTYREVEVGLKKAATEEAALRNDWTPSYVSQHVRYLQNIGRQLGHLVDYDVLESCFT